MGIKAEGAHNFTFYSGKLEDARKMLELGLEVKLINQVTGLSHDDLLALRCDDKEFIERGVVLKLVSVERPHYMGGPKRERE